MPWQIQAHELLQWRRERCRQGADQADLDWLLTMAGDLAWGEVQTLALHPERDLNLALSLEGLTHLWNRHEREGIPLQYLVGRCPWRDLELSVAPGVLIPRQETELLVDFAIEQVEAEGWNDGPRLWADLGTGSGCLAVALGCQWPGSEGLAVDQSIDALEQAAANLARHGLGERVTTRLGHWWEPLQQHWGRLELVVANPPYIPESVWSELEPIVRDQEPQTALAAGPDGLEAIREIVAGASTALEPGGWLMLEHHHDQSEAVQALLEVAGLASVAPLRDLEGHWRFVKAQRRHQ